MGSLTFAAAAFAEIVSDYPQMGSRKCEESALPSVVLCLVVAQRTDETITFLVL
jgi:hypothetical protein